MPNFSQIGSEMVNTAHLAKLANQLTNQPLPIVIIALTHHLSNLEPFGTSMPNFS
jgi:hypothetical protein